MSFIREEMEVEEDLMVQIEEQSEILDDIFEKIDKLQDENDELHILISDLEIQLNRTKRKDCIATQTNKRLKKERQSKSDAPIQKDLLDEEHQRYIKEKENAVKLLINQLDDLQNSYNDQENDLKEITSENNENELEINAFEQDIAEELNECKIIAQEIRIKNAEIIHQKAKISELNKRISENRKTMRNVVNMIENDSYDSKDMAAVYRDIDSVKADIDYYTMKIDEAKSNLLALQEEEDAKIAKIKKEKDKDKALIGWSSEREYLEGEYNTVSKKEKKVDEELESATNYNKLLRKRLSKLEPIFKRWESKYRGRRVDCEIEDDIDSMLKEVDLKNKKSEKEGRKTPRKTPTKTPRKTPNKTPRKDNQSNVENEELSMLIAENRALEQKIETRKRMLYSTMEIFKGEEAMTKQNISNLRNAAFDKENKLIEEIKTLKLKNADKKH